MYVDTFTLVVNVIPKHPDQKLRYNDTMAINVTARVFSSYPSDAQKDKVMDELEETYEQVNYCTVEKRRAKVKAE